MKGAGIILSKELKRVFGDRKLVFSLFILPVILVVGIYGLIGMMIGNMQSDIEEHVPNVYVVNQNASLEAAISQAGFDKYADITYLTASEYAGQKDEIAAEMLEGHVDLIVVQDPDFDTAFLGYSAVGDRIPKITVYRNTGENYSSQAYSVFSQVLSNYRSMLQAQRLGNLEILNVFEQVDEIIVKEEKANSEFFAMMLPYLITMLLFAGAMSVGVDAIAGEKERGTLASMLITPVGRNAIAVGKLVSMAILSGISAIVYTGAMVLAMPFMGNIMGEAAEAGFGGISFGFVQAVELLVIMLAMVYLYVALIGFLSVLAKNVKTATTYISPVYIVVIVAGMLTMFNTGKEIPVTRYCIPVYGNALAISDLCVNELTAVNFLASLSGTLIVAVILTAGIAKAFNSEKFMFTS